jgi:cytochrome d ubiquinol oxidase subunit II
MTGLTIALTFLTIFLNLYPHVLVSSTNRAFSLNVLNAASSSYTLTVMTVVAFIFTPIVLLYQGWTYWVFRQRVGSDDFALPAILQKKPVETSLNGD